MSRQIILSQGAVEAGLWCVLSLRYDKGITYEIQQTPPDMTNYWSHKLKIDPQMKEDLAVALQEEVRVVRNQHRTDQSLGAEESHYIYPQFDRIWKRVVSVKKRAKERPETAIPATVYEQLHTRGITFREMRSLQGMVRWPPTCQTIAKRCGGSWNNALKNMGLMTSKRGRTRGLLKFNDEKYPQASVELILHCRQVGRATTVVYHYQWAAREHRSDRIWPSAAIQHQLRGTWDHVMELGQKIV